MSHPQNDYRNRDTCAGGDRFAINRLLGNAALLQPSSFVAAVEFATNTISEFSKKFEHIGPDRQYFQPG